MTAKAKFAIAWLGRLFTAVMACGLLIACGQKGPLFLPEPAEAEIGPVDAEQDADQQEDEDDDAGSN